MKRSKKCEVSTPVTQTLRFDSDYDISGAVRTRFDEIRNLNNSPAHSRRTALILYIVSCLRTPGLPRAAAVLLCEMRLGKIPLRMISMDSDSLLLYAFSGLPTWTASYVDRDNNSKAVLRL